MSKNQKDLNEYLEPADDDDSESDIYVEEGGKSPRPSGATKTTSSLSLAKMNPAFKSTTGSSTTQDPPASLAAEAFKAPQDPPEAKNTRKTASSMKQPDKNLPPLTQQRLQEEEANRRHLYTILGILALGASVIAIVVGVILAGNNNNNNKNNDSSLEGVSPTKAPVNTVLPTLVPTLQPLVPTTPPSWHPSPRPSVPRTDGPTLSPTTLSPSSLPSFLPSIAPVTSSPTTLQPSRITPTLSLEPSASPSTSKPSASPSTSVPSAAPSVSPTARPTSSLQGLIVSIFGDTGFDSPDSYQSQALTWLETQSQLYPSQTKLLSRYTAACLYYATFGVLHRYANPDELEWNDSTNWLTDQDECTWFGLLCNPSGQVNETDLHANNVTGTLPLELMGWSDSLRLLDVGNNNIWNKNEEVEFLGELTNLVYLDIGVTYFDYDGIPAAIGQLTNLQHLDIAYTLFFGPIRPEAFVNLKQLQILDMGGNAYNQSLPSELTTLPLLENLYCDNAFLAGTLDFIADMQSIFELWLDLNPGLGGTIPTEIGLRYNTLESLSLTDCSLSGTIPTELGNLLLMQQIWLYGNNLEGSIPGLLADLQFMTILELQQNRLEGSVPLDMCGNFPQNNVDVSLCVDCDLVECCCCTCCTSNSCR